MRGGEGSEHHFQAVFWEAMQTPGAFSHSWAVKGLSQHCDPASQHIQGGMQSCQLSVRAWLGQEELWGSAGCPQGQQEGLGTQAALPSFLPGQQPWGHVTAAAGPAWELLRGILAMAGM